MVWETTLRQEWRKDTRDFIMSSVDWASCQTTLKCVLYDILSTGIRNRTEEFDKYCVHMYVVRVFGCHSSSVQNTDIRSHTSIYQVIIYGLHEYWGKFIYEIIYWLLFQRERERGSNTMESDGGVLRKE